LRQARLPPSPTPPPLLIYESSPEQIKGGIRIVRRQLLAPHLPPSRLRFAAELFPRKEYRTIRRAFTLVAWYLGRPEAAGRNSGHAARGKNKKIVYLNEVDICAASAAYSRSRDFDDGDLQTFRIKNSPYSITERRVPQLIPVLGSQPAGNVSHKPGSRLSLLSAKPVVTLATLKKAATNFAAFVNRGTMGVNSLPKTAI